MKGTCGVLVVINELDTNEKIPEMIGKGFGLLIDLLTFHLRRGGSNGYNSAFKTKLSYAKKDIMEIKFVVDFVI